MGGTSGAIRHLVIFEWRIQRREFLTWLAALVLLLLPLGYGASGVVELVGSRGPAPRAAPWAVAQAMAGLTAFGQVITAMIAATTVLRDVTLRTQGLILTTPLPWPTYLCGRFLGTLGVLLVVYAMIPLGLALGFALGDPMAVGPWRLTELIAPFALLVLPTVVLVASVFFAAGARSGGFAVILLVGIGLIGLWQTGLSLVARGVDAGVWLDPFGNALLTELTREWAEADRRARLLPWRDLLWHRAAWLMVSLGLLTWTIRTWRPSALAPDVTARAEAACEEPVARVPRSRITPAMSTRRSTWHQLAAEWRFGWQWVRRERAVRALVLLAVLNAGANGWSVAGEREALLRAVEFHARLFAILVATIYAGELVWRDREVRIDEMLRVIPQRAGIRLVGRSAGVFAALFVLPLALWVVTIGLPLMRGGVPAPWCSARWLFGVSTPQLVAVLVSALAVHLIMRAKTVAHLVVIGAWVTAIALGARALAEPWGGYGVC